MNIGGVLGGTPMKQFTVDEVERIKKEMDEMRNCPVCNSRPLGWSTGGICSVCQAKIKREDREKYLSALEERPIEVRVKLIEEWMYDHSRQRHAPIDYVMR